MNKFNWHWWDWIIDRPNSNRIEDRCFGASIGMGMTGLLAYVGWSADASQVLPAFATWMVLICVFTTVACVLGFQRKMRERASSASRKEGDSADADQGRDQPTGR